MGSLLIRWIVNALALFVVSYLVPGITARSLVALLIAALVLGLLNAIVKPVLFWLTLPITVVTLGLFLIVINAVVLELAALFVPGFRIESFLSAMAGALILSIIGLFTSGIGKDRKRD